MIKIRYSELPAGLHVRAETHGRSTFIYLVPGLTLAERRAALLRIRRSASMGYGPRLPAVGLAAAIARDRIRATIWNGTSAFRAHPILLLPVVVVLTATMVYIMTADVTLTIHSPQSGPGPFALGPGSNHGPRGPAAYPVGAKGPAGSVPSPGRPSPGPTPGQHSRSPSPTGSRRPRPTPGTSSPAPTTPPGSGSPTPGPTTSPPVPSPSPSASGTCVRVGPLGICLHF